MVVGEITQEREVVIIGGGPGGYTAAIRGAQLGLSITLIEQEHLGGVCLNKGCIPSKIFTHAAAKRAEVAHLLEIGIGDGSDSFSIQKLQAYKTKVIEGLRAGVEGLCKANKIEIIRGKATLIGADKIGVENGHQFDTFVFKQAIIATGSRPSIPERLTDRGSRVLFSNEIYQLKEVPSNLIVWGHDYIALEVASSYAALGAKVTVLLNGSEDFQFDVSITKELHRLFKKRKIQVIRNANDIQIDESQDRVTVNYQTNDGSKASLEGTHCFISEKRVPNVDDLGIDRLGMVQVDDGFIKIDAQMQTSIPRIYAIGDVSEGPLLAVKAIKQGKAAVEAIAGGTPEVDDTFTPTMVHTVPPIAAVGLTEQEAKNFGMDYRVGQFSIRGNGYATLTGKQDGLIKVISDVKTDLLLGIHMIGEGAVEMSGSFVQLLEMAAKEEDVKFPTYAHPSINEGLQETIESLIGQAIHLLPKKS